MKKRIEYPAYPEVFLDVLSVVPSRVDAARNRSLRSPDFADMSSRKLSFMVLREVFWGRRSKSNADQSRLGQDSASM